MENLGFMFGWFIRIFASKILENSHLKLLIKLQVNDKSSKDIRKPLPQMLRV